MKALVSTCETRPFMPLELTTVTMIGLDSLVSHAQICLLYLLSNNNVGY